MSRNQFESNPVGVKLLNEQLSLAPSELLCWLRSDRGVEALLAQSQPKEECRRLLVLAIAKVSKAQKSEILCDVLERFKNSMFFSSLPAFLFSANTSSARDRNN